MPSTGPHFATAGTSETYSGGATWTGTGNITADDGTSCNSGTVSVGGSTDWLCATFSGAIALATLAGATICGVMLEYKHRSTASGFRPAEVVLERDGVVVSVNKAVTRAANVADLPTSFAYQSYGSAGETWGVRWDARDFIGTNLKAKIRYTAATTSGTIRVDAVRLTVHYAASGYTPDTYDEDFSGGAGDFTEIPNGVGDWDFTGGRATLTTAVANGTDIDSLTLAGLTNVNRTYAGAKGSEIILEDIQFGGSGSPGFGVAMFGGAQINEKCLVARISSTGTGARVWTWDGMARSADDVASFSFSEGMSAKFTVWKGHFYIHTAPSGVDGPWTQVYHKYYGAVVGMVGKHGLRHPHSPAGASCSRCIIQPTTSVPSATDSPTITKKLGMNVGEAGSMNASPMMEFANAAKMMDRMVQKTWAGSTVADDVGQKDANGWYKYLKAGADYVGNDTVLIRKEEVAARNLQSTNWVATWTGTGTLSLTNTVGSPSSSTGRLEFQIAAVDHVAMILTGLPASPGGTGHFKDLWIGPLSEEGSAAIPSTPLKQKLAPFAGGALRMMIMNRVAEAGWDPITEQRPLETDAVWANTLKGVPVSVQVKLAKQCGMIPWLNVTHKAAGTGDGPDATYANLFIAEAEAACDEGDTVIVEFSNEAWNQTFAAWTYFKGKGNTLFATGNDYEDSQRYYAMKAMQWALACKAAETGKCKFKYVLGAFILDNISNQSVRAQSYAGLYVQDVFDAFAIAAYFGGDFGVSDPGHYGETILDNLALIGQAATIDAMFTQADSMIAAFDDEVADGKAAWASTGLPMWIYEGLSQHPLFDYDPVNMTTNTDFHACFEAYLSDPRIYALTKKIVNAGYKYCDGPACYFNLAGQRPIDLPCVGMFGSMKYASSNPSDDASGAYRAIVDIASGGGGASGGIGPKKITGKFTASKVTSKKVSGI